MSSPESLRSRLIPIRISTFPKTLRAALRQDPDVKKAPGTQPAPYYGGLSKATKKRRLAHFKKYSKYDDDNPAAYKPAPGDARAKTKPSKHTLKYRRMYGEDAVEFAKKKIEREKMKK